MRIRPKAIMVTRNELSNKLFLAQAWHGSQRPKVLSWKTLLRKQHRPTAHSDDSEQQV